MSKSKLTNSEKPLDTALHALAHLTDSDDLRWLSAYIAIEKLDGRAEIRGIGYHGYGQSAALRHIVEQVGTLTADELATFQIVIALLRQALQPVMAESRGYVQIKTQKRSYPQIDFETGLPQLDEQGTPILLDFYYPYAYVRLYAAKGDADHKRAKLLSIYADRGSGTAKQGGGFGGIVARALTDGIITQNEILDSWHRGTAAYAAFIDHCKLLIGDNKLPGQNTKPN